MNGSESGNDRLEPDLWLERLAKLANQKAAASESMADLEKAASAAALIASARKSREDLARNAYRLRLDEAKSWAFLAIPFLILMGVLVFLPKPDQQAKAMREASADAEFRDVEKAFLAQLIQPGTVPRPDLMLLTTPLQPYLNDERYGKEAADLSLLALSHANSGDAFQDYFVSRNIRVSAQNLATILTLDRMLYTNFNELDDAVNSDSQSSVSGRPLTRDQSQRARDATLIELTFLSAKIAGYLRTYNAAPVDTDLRRVYFKGVDLSNVEFGKSNLEGCQWEGVSLNNTDLSGVTQFDSSQWIDANWWDARKVSRPLLSYLITNQYPFHPPVVDYTDAPSSREEYQQKVLKLCKTAGLACDITKMPYGTAKGEKRAKAAVAAPTTE